MKITYKSEITRSENLSPDDFISKLLTNRGISDYKSFMNPVSPLTMSLKDFGFDREIDILINILKKTHASKRHIVVYTDYDADGITGGSILWETLHLLGFKAMPYVPHRKHEGYGFSILGIDKVKADYDPALIMSVDHGITGVDKVEYAKSIGIPVVITDHHHRQEKIPEAAEAIFHIPVLSGSGVAYFVAKEIYEHFKDQTPHANKLKKYFETDYLSLATIGTVADLVPLVGASRSVVFHGLEAFPHVNRVGLRQLCKQAKIEDKVISPYEIGFIIAPRINAVGRLEHAIDALRLLCTTSVEKAAELAGKVGQMNEDRKELVKKNVEEAKLQVESMRVDGNIPKIIIIHAKHWHEGVIGLIASNILEQYYRPVIVMTEGEGLFKGSARSITSFHITHFFEELKDYFINFGGHAGAAGFSLQSDKLDQFKKAAVKLADTLIKDEDLERVVNVDMKAPVSMMSIPIARAIEALSPFGIGNPQPSFVSDVELLRASLLGKSQDHLKILVKDIGSSAFPLELVGFGKAKFFAELVKGQKIQIAYQIDINRWNGKENLQGKLLHVNTFLQK